MLLVEHYGELLLAGEMRCLTDFLTAIKRKLATAVYCPIDPYKFTGDGWILLFPLDTDGAALIAFLERLCRFYENEFRTRVQPNLTIRQSWLGFPLESTELAVVNEDVRAA